MILDYTRLMRIQSIPLTIAIISAGYMIETGSIIEMGVLPLLVVGAVGHAGFYTMNEILDMEWDIEQYKSDKPLVSGDIPVENAITLCFSLILVSIFGALLFFPLESFLLYLASCGAGSVYNFRSKNDPLSSVYLGAWGVLILLTGFYYAGGA